MALMMVARAAAIALLTPLVSLRKHDRTLEIDHENA